MARLHKEYNQFNGKLVLTKKRKESLLGSRDSLRTKIENYFKEEKSDELQPTFEMQGSFEMNTVVNPIIEYDDDENAIRKYDLDDGVCFIEIEGEDNRKEISTWHDLVYNAVNDHTGNESIRKATCVRVVFSDGHNVDLPIRYINDGDSELAHRSEGWIISEPKEFSDWFNAKANKKIQIRRLVRYAKGWKNYRQLTNNNLKFPSGFEMAILITENYQEDDFDDNSFRLTMSAVLEKLNDKFECKRPTTPTDDDLFESYSEIRRNDFLNELEKLVDACNKADEEDNFKTASEYLRSNIFGERFPLGKDESSKQKSSRKSSLIGVPLAPKPYAE